jgi:hypothetical protein
MGSQAWEGAVRRGSEWRSGLQGGERHSTRVSPQPRAAELVLDLGLVLAAEPAFVRLLCMCSIPLYSGLDSNKTIHDLKMVRAVSIPLYSGLDSNARRG